MASTVAMRPSETRTRKDAHPLIAMRARCYSDIPGHTQTSMSATNKDTHCTQKRERAPMMRCDRNVCMPLILGLGIVVYACSCSGSCAPLFKIAHLPLFIRFRARDTFWSFLPCASCVLERGNLVNHAFWRGETLFKGVRGVGHRCSSISQGSCWTERGGWISTRLFKPYLIMHQQS